MIPVIQSVFLVPPAVDFTAFYAKSWAMVDFSLLLALFTGAATATIGKRLGGKGGQMVSVALGGVLAFGAIAFEAQAGINLSHLGGIAGILLLLTIGAVIFYLAQGFGLRAGSSIAASGLVLAFGLSAVPSGASGLLGWITPLAQVAGMLGGGFLLMRVFSKKSEKQSVRQVSSALRNDKVGASGHRLQGNLVEEKRTISQRLRPITKKERKTSQRILHELKLIAELLKHQPLSARDKKRLADGFSAIPPKRHDLLIMLERIRRIDSSLLNFDISKSVSLGQRVTKMSHEDRRLLKRLILEERRKVGIEKRIERIERFVKVYEMNAGRTVQRCAELLIQGNIEETRRWIHAAIRYEEEAAREIERVRAVERMLQRLTNLEIRQIRKVA